MNITSILLVVAIGLVCVFVVLAFFISRITSVRIDTAIEKVNGRIDSYYDSNRETWFALAKRVKKLEESRICILDTNTDEAEETYLCAITKEGYSTVVVSLTENELAAIESFIDWADLEEEFSMVKIDKNYVAEDWGKKK